MWLLPQLLLVLIRYIKPRKPQARVFLILSIEPELQLQLERELTQQLLLIQVLNVLV